MKVRITTMLATIEKSYGWYPWLLIYDDSYPYSLGFDRYKNHNKEMEVQDFHILKIDTHILPMLIQGAIAYNDDRSPSWQIISDILRKEDR